MTVRRPEPSEYEARYAGLVGLVPEDDLFEGLSRQLGETRAFFAGIPESLIDSPCEAGEWTIRDILGHMVDTERLFGYRILCFARGDGRSVERADQELYAKNAGLGRCVFADLLDEFELVRRSHISMLRHLPEEAWDRSGTVAGKPISVRAMAFLMLAHERHHLDSVRANYLQATG